MSHRYSPYPCVVVGSDGSRSAVQAAIWAVDEATHRDIPLLLLYAIDTTSNDPDDVAAEGATAKNTIHNVFTKIQSAGIPVKLESEIVHSHPVAALLDASRSAAMICVGSIGFTHATQGPIGSTASALATAAHCPVAIVPRTARSAPARAGLVVAAVDRTAADNAVLELAIAEARLRDAPLRVFTGRQPRRTGTAEEERELSRWRQSHPDLDIEWLPEHGGLLNYLEQLQRSATPVQLVVVDPSRPGPIDVLLSPSGRTALEAAGCSLMVCDRHRWL